MSEVRTVLVVDDEPGLRETLAANLELEGFRVREAANAIEALAACAAEPIDLVLTDIRMPEIDGVELFHRLRMAGHRMPVVLMTGFALEQLVQGALEDGAWAVLPKPFEVQHVLEVVNAAVRAPIVLVIDDVESVAVTTAAALQSSGLKAAAVTTVAEAIATVRDGAVDVCVVDLVMPQMSGAELVTKLREVSRNLSVIAMSGEDVPQLIRQMAAGGMHTFFQKPVPMRALVRSIAGARAARRPRPVTP